MKKKIKAWAIINPTTGKIYNELADEMEVYPTNMPNNTNQKWEEAQKRMGDY